MRKTVVLWPKGNEATKKKSLFFRTRDQAVSDAMAYCLFIHIHQLCVPIYQGIPVLKWVINHNKEKKKKREENINK